MTRALTLLALLLGISGVANAETRWAIVVCGASGGPKYAEQMRQWRDDLRLALVDRYGFDPSRVRMLVDETVKAGEQATADNVRRLVGDVRKAGAKDDFILLVLFGHGTYDGDVAKFNLVGPDLTAREWTDLLSGLPGRLVAVNTTEASFPFLSALAAKGRVVITATDSPAQKYATVFPEFFVKATREASSDLDKNGRTSIFEVFSAASLGVKQYYEQKGQLATERSLIDDTGDGVGREADAPGPDGGLARLAFLDADPSIDAANPELAALVRRRRQLEGEAEELKLKKDEMPDAEWRAQFEKLMIELAQVSQEIRKKT